eukprot:Pgem_evm1s17831
MENAADVIEIDPPQQQCNWQYSRGKRKDQRCHRKVVDNNELCISNYHKYDKEVRPKVKKIDKENKMMRQKHFQDSPCFKLYRKRQIQRQIDRDRDMAIRRNYLTLLHYLRQDDKLDGPMLKFIDVSFVLNNSTEIIEKIGNGETPVLKYT